MASFTSIVASVKKWAGESRKLLITAAGLVVVVGGYVAQYGGLLNLTPDQMNTAAAIVSLATLIVHNFTPNNPSDATVAKVLAANAPPAVS